MENNNNDSAIVGYDNDSGSGNGNDNGNGNGNANGTRQFSINSNNTHNKKRGTNNKSKFSSSLLLHPYYHPRRWIVIFLVIPLVLLYPILLLYQWRITDYYRITFFASSVLFSQPQQQQQQTRAPVVFEHEDNVLRQAVQQQQQQHCDNDPDFRYQGIEHKDCATWVRTSKKENCRKTQVDAKGRSTGQQVFYYCPQQCKEECKNNTTIPQPMSSLSNRRKPRPEKTAANNAIGQQQIADIGMYTVQASDDISPPSIVHTLPLNTTTINNSLPLRPILTTGCCGLGHRLSNCLRTFVYALRQGRTVKVQWHDVSWSVLFHNTEYIAAGIGKKKVLKKAKEQGLFFPNIFPKNWSGLPIQKQKKTGSALDKFDPNLLDHPLGTAILVSLRDALTPLVLSYLSPLRAQLNHYPEEQKKKQYMTLCTHIRQGNNETGDWQRKTWRHIDLHTILTSTQRAMEQLVLARNATAGASIYVASDNAEVAPWFAAHRPTKWTVIQPGKMMPRPEQGVWFGEPSSRTNRILNKTMKHEAMAAALADAFALGECDALFIPNYSSFSYAGIALTQARGKSVFFGKQQQQEDDDKLFTYLEMK